MLSVQYSCAVVYSSFLVVAGNSSQNEIMFLQKVLLGGLLYYDPLISQKYRDLSVQVQIGE